MEEVQLDVQVSDYLGVKHLPYKNLTLELHFFKVHEFTGQVTLNAEHTDFAWVAPDQLINYDMISSDLSF